MLLVLFIVFCAFCFSPSVGTLGAVEILLCGAAVSAAVFLLCCRFLGYSFKKELLLWRCFPLLLLYGLSLILEILKANLAVFRKVWKKGLPEGAIVRFRSGLCEPFAIALLANAITLTPGTITVHTEPDGRFTVHCLYPEFGQGLETSMPARCASKIDRIYARANEKKRKTTENKNKKQNGKKK